MNYENLLHPHKNHFNLIRLFAALQVAFFHADALLPVEVSNPVVLFVKKMWWFFPGVNMFFFISGFLVWRSLEQSTHIFQFYSKRIKRIYPALYTAFIIVTILLALDGQFADIRLFSYKIARWLFAQLTFFQYFVPLKFGDYGVGHPNGPLWSVAVEVQFYLVLPLIFKLVQQHSRSIKNSVIALLSAASYTFNHLQELHMEKDGWYLLTQFSVINYFYFFGIGILIYINFDKLHTYFVNYGKWFMLLFILCVIRWVWLERYYEAYHANSYNTLVSIMLALFVFSAAFIQTGKEKYFIQQNDFSYGLYLYHAPVINFIYTYGLRSWGNIIFWPLSFTFAILSWYIIEKPFLKTKKTDHAR